MQPKEFYDSSGDGVAGQKITAPVIKSPFTRTRKPVVPISSMLQTSDAQFTSIIVFRTNPPASHVERLSGPIGGASLRHCLLSEAVNCRADIATT